jgi:hypothetical protein
MTKPEDTSMNEFLSSMATRAFENGRTTVEWLLELEGYEKDVKEWIKRVLDAMQQSPNVDAGIWYDPDTYPDIVD